MLMTALLCGLAGCRASAKPTHPSRPVVKFTDVTAAAGLSFKQSHGGCGLRYFVEQVASGAAFLDANGDGSLDIYFPQPKPLGACKSKFKEPLRQRLYLNDGKGRFTLSSDAFGNAETDYGIGAAVGDYDNDGRPDLYVACYGRNALFHNRGDGTFEDVTDPAGVGLKGFSTAAVWFDYDSDGYLDLYVLRYCEWSVEKDIPCPGPHGERDVCSPQTYTPATHVLYRNNGNGTFTEVTRQAKVGGERRRGLGVAAADFNSDGRLDLFVANDLGPNFLYLNQGNGTFKDVAMQQSVAFGITGRAQANMGVAAGDCDGDEDLDVLVTVFSNEPYTLYRNEGGYFTDVSFQTGIGEATMPFLGFGTGFIDVRNNSNLDLFFANGHVSPFIHLKYNNIHYKQRNHLLLNDGQGDFTEIKTALPKDNVRVHRGACFGDVNNDGRIDILVTANDDRPTLLRNDSTPGNYLLLKLTDAHGCATPIGTRCVATVGSRKLLRVVLGGGSYGGDSDHRVHFGLGDATQVDRLEIRWLSGRTQVLHNVKGNQILIVHEGEEGTTR